MLTSITTESEYQSALKQIDELIARYPFNNIVDELELERISDLVWAYEEVHCPMD